MTHPLKIWFNTCSFCCQQFLSLGLQSLEDHSEHDLAGMADEANGTLALTLLEVALSLVKVELLFDKPNKPSQQYHAPSYPQPT